MSQTESTTFVGARQQVQELPARISRLRGLAIFGLISSLSIGAAAIFIGLQVQEWPYLVISAVAVVVALASSLSLVLSGGERINTAIWILLGAMSLGLPAVAVSINQTGVFLAVIGGLVLPEFFRPALAPRHQRTALYISLGAGLTALLIDFGGPAGRLSVPVSSQIIVGLNILLVLLSAIRLAQQFDEFTLRTKLLLSFLGVSIVPLALMSYISDQSIRSALREEANDKLFSAAAQTAETLDTFIQTRKTDIETQAQFSAYQNYLQLPTIRRDGSDAEEQALDLLFAPTRRVPVEIQSLALLDASGINVLDTQQVNIGQDESSLPYFRRQ